MEEHEKDELVLARMPFVLQLAWRLHKSGIELTAIGRLLGFNTEKTRKLISSARRYNEMKRKSVDHALSVESDPRDWVRNEYSVRLEL